MSLSTKGSVKAENLAAARAALVARAVTRPISRVKSPTTLSASRLRRDQRTTARTLWIIRYGKSVPYLGFGFHRRGFRNKSFRELAPAEFTHRHLEPFGLQRFPF